MKKALLVGLLLACCATITYAQGRRITGRVTEAGTGDPLAGVTIQLKGTSSGTVTGTDGTYALTATNDAVLIFSFLGYVTQEETVGQRSSINIILAVDEAKLSEVVVVGYGEQTQRYKTQNVSVVGEENIKNVPAVSPQQLLQGQAAGVQMTNSSGLLGSAAQIRIRGASSITAGGQPLFVVDGVPLNEGLYSTGQGGAARLNPLLNINPNDIETMTVLKDAAAVAIYGSRGANGVVLITTKRGSANQKTRVNFDYYTGWSKPTGLIPMMDAEQYKTYVNDFNAAKGLPAETFPDGEFDWVDAVTRTGRVNNYSLSAAGGNEKTKFYFGGAYSKESGFTIGNDLKKLSGRLNLEHNISGRVKFGVNFNTSYADMDRIGAENSTYAPLTSSFLQLPYVQPFDDNGQYVNTGFVQNVLGLEALNLNKFYTTRSTGNAYAEFRLFDNLKFKTDWGIDRVQAEEKYREVDLFTPGGIGSRVIIQDFKWMTTNSLNYDKVINNDHTIGAFAAHSFETSRFEDITVEGAGFASDKLVNVISASTPTITSSEGTEWALESYILRGNYRFRDKYLLEGTFRSDGSSRFDESKRYGSFWAVSGGWILTEESFLNNSSWLNFLKLTASYGTSGNNEVSNFPYPGLYGGGTDADYGGAAGLRPTQTPNPALSWEETAQFDVSLSSVFVDNRIKLDVTYYHKKTTDPGLLVDIPIPYTTGFSIIKQNVGKMENKGIEIGLNTVNIRKKDFEWSTSLNISFVKNKMLALPEDTKDEYGRPYVIAASNAQRAVLGHSLNSFYLIRFHGINPQTGDAEWLDRDGKPTTSPTNADRVIVGNADPKFYGGFNNTVAYKGFDLGVNFNFMYGNKVLLDGLRFTGNMANNGLNKSSDLLDYWKNPGDNTYAPALASTTTGTFSRLSTLQLQDGSYLRLKMLTLGYNLPKNLLSGTKVLTNARIYALAQNIWTIKNKDFKGADPEVSANGGSNQVVGESFFALPQPKTITVGVNLTF